MTSKDVYWLRPIAIFLSFSKQVLNAKIKGVCLLCMQFFIKCNMLEKKPTSPRRRVEGKELHYDAWANSSEGKKKWGFEFFTILFKLWTYIVASSHHLICIKNRQIWTGHKEIERLFSNPHALCEHLARRRRGNTIILFTFTVIISWQIWSHS